MRVWLVEQLTTRGWETVAVFSTVGQADEWGYDQRITGRFESGGWHVREIVIDDPPHIRRPPA